MFHKFPEALRLHLPPQGVAGRPRRRQCLSAAASSTPSRGAVLICPGFLFGSRPYEPLRDALTARGFAAAVVPLSRAAWLPVLAGSDFQFFLNRIDAALVELYDTHGSVAIVGHSAGGWISRILLGPVPYQGKKYDRAPLVRSLVTLGTPHTSIEAYPFGRVPERLDESGDGGPLPPDVRGSSLRFTNHLYPRGDAFSGVQVVCAVGDAITGEEPAWRRFGRKRKDGGGSGGGGGGKDSWVAWESYKSGCGQGAVPGDGVTPCCIAHLPGAENLVLPGVWHGPGGRPGRPWYGDAGPLERWERYLEAGYAAP
jgi:hypothetical protein